MLSPPVTGFATFARGSQCILGTGTTVEEAREQAVDAIRAACMARDADTSRARRAFTAAMRDLATYPATAALIDAVDRGETPDWEIHEGAACTLAEVHGIEAEIESTGMRLT